MLSGWSVALEDAPCRASLPLSDALRRRERETCSLAPGPLPPLRVSVAHATSNSVNVTWRGPGAAASALGGFALRYRTRAEPRWAALELRAPAHSSAEVPAPHCPSD